MSQHKEFEQIHWNKLFCRIYGLAVMLSIPRQPASKNIEEINEKIHKYGLTFTDMVYIHKEKTNASYFQICNYIII